MFVRTTQNVVSQKITTGIPNLSSLAVVPYLFTIVEISTLHFITTSNIMVCGVVFIGARFTSF